MPDDQMFRLIVSLEIVSLLPVMAFYRIRSQATGEKLDRRQEGLFILIALRLMGFVCFGGFLTMLIHPTWLDWSAAEFPTRLRWIGVGLLAIAGVVIVWAFHNLGRNLTDTVVTRKVHTLVFSGPYRWVRHPFYVGLAFFICAIWLAMANWYFLVTGVAVLSLLALRVPKEEAKLVERFGDDYRQYMQSTPRFLPRFSRASSVQTRPVIRK